MTHTRTQSRLLEDSGTGNHTPRRLVVKSGIKAGARDHQHNTKRLVVKSGVKAGGFSHQHNTKRLVVPDGSPARRVQSAA